MPREQPTPKYAPTVRARRLARILRDLRIAAGFKGSRAAKLLGWSPSKMSHIEHCRSKPSVGDVDAALDLYRVPSPDRELLLTLAREIDKHGWWTAFADVFTGSYVALEDEANLIREWQLTLIPGLLQTEDYAYALEALSARHRGGGDEEVQRRVQARMARKTLLKRTDPAAPELHVVLDESALRRPIGGHEVMRDQLYALRAAAKRPNVTVQVLPNEVGAHAGLDGSFIHLGYADDIDPDIVFVEGGHGDVYLERPEDVDGHRVKFKELSGLALSPKMSEDFITRLIKE